MLSKTKIIHWIKRYGPAEIAGTTTAMLTATITYALTKNEIITAVAGAWGENIGFYGVMVGRDIHLSRKHHKIHGKNYTAISLIVNIKDIIFEFGFAEVLDSFFIRPFMMYIFPKLTGSIETGIFAGKIAADIIIYIPVIVSYELHQIYKNRKKP